MRTLVWALTSAVVLGACGCTASKPASNPARPASQPAPTQSMAMQRVPMSPLDPKQQAITFDSGYFYPGPAIKGVTIDMAPQKSQDIIKQYGRPEYDDLIKNNPIEVSLPPQDQVTAFGLWDQKIGSTKK